MLCERRALSKGGCIEIKARVCRESSEDVESSWIEFFSDPLPSPPTLCTMTSIIFCMEVCKSFWLTVCCSPACIERVWTSLKCSGIIIARLSKLPLFVWLYIFYRWNVHFVWLTLAPSLHSRKLNLLFNYMRDNPGCMMQLKIILRLFNGMKNNFFFCVPLWKCARDFSHPPGKLCEYNQPERDLHAGGGGGVVNEPVTRQLKCEQFSIVSHKNGRRAGETTTNSNFARVANDIIKFQLVCILTLLIFPIHLHTSHFATISWRRSETHRTHVLCKLKLVHQHSAECMLQSSQSW